MTSPAEETMASHSGMLGELFRRVTLEESGEYSGLSDALDDEEYIPTFFDEENAHQTVVGCHPTTYTSDGGGCTDQPPPQAKFILAKIAKNEQAGKAHERDAEDRVKYEAAIREYEAASAAKLIQPQQHPQQQPKPARSSAKRNRSQDVSERVAKRSKHSSTQGAGGPSTSAAGAASRAAYSEVARDHLQVALVDAKTKSGRAVLPLWDAIEGRLSGMVVRHLMDKKGPAPLFDSGEIFRGCRVIKCANQYSREFLEKSLATVSNAWEGLSLKLIPASEIPRRPRARIWLPKMELDSSEIVPCLKLQNPEVPMDDWSVIKVEEPQQHSSAILLLINNESWW
ncbi:uncharacterized protein LOC128869741 [Anastrepha ludens]|uniref:uncharacterized protein LOC128869741 n=1 Tax=Anastrepha ludens TaxID=28586 RepID=UPI0023B1662B|nr:uncharacterized protein LOC128869741 [Anastrepha ludens]